MPNVPRPVALVMLSISMFATWTTALNGQRQMENLTRGVVAVKLPDGGVYVSWRLMGTDPHSIGFNLYRSEDSHDAVKVNNAPVTESTNLVDRAADASATLRYAVCPVVDGQELTRSEPVRAWEDSYLVPVS